jgi:hypothetical protein
LEAVAIRKQILRLILHGVAVVLPQVVRKFLDREARKLVAEVSMPN